MKLFCPQCTTPVVIPSAAQETTCPQCNYRINITQLNTQAHYGQPPIENDYTGEIIDTFAIEAVLGHGGMGTVYRAQIRSSALA